jgi:hypothetical protein
MHGETMEKPGVIGKREAVDKSMAIVVADVNPRQLKGSLRRLTSAATSPRAYKPAVKL